MGEICLSLAPILRCEGLTQLEHEILIIPAAVGVIFSVTLAISKWGSGRSHLVLAAEGLAVFSLALFELLSHIIPAARDSITIFRILDIVLGALSFIPIALYITFLFLLTHRGLIPTLPERFQNVTRYTLILFIPVIIASELLGSFLGVSYRIVQNPANPAEQTLAIGFESDKDQLLWTFFSSLALAVLTAYQAITFAGAFYRLVKAIADQRSIEVSSRTDQEGRLLRGTGWIALGLTLGAIETVIGFAQPGFGTAITRSVLRFLGRALLIIGVIKGLDTVEDFWIFEDKIREKQRRSVMRLAISNPRHSTFRRLSDDGGVTAAYAASIPPPDIRTRMSTDQLSYQSAKIAMPVPRYKTPNWPAMVAASIATRSNSSRVTVIYDEPRPPTLHMRFSDLSSLPSPSMLKDTFEKQGHRRSRSDWIGRSPRGERLSAGLRTHPYRRGSSEVTPSAEVRLSAFANIDSVPASRRESYQLRLPPAVHWLTSRERMPRVRGYSSQALSRDNSWTGFLAQPVANQSVQSPAHSRTASLTLDNVPQSVRQSVVESQPRERLQSARSLDSGWAEDEGVVQEVDDVRLEEWRRSGHTLTTMKNFSRAPVKNTPTPTHSAFSRGSMAAEQVLELPPLSGYKETVEKHGSFDARSTVSTQVGEEGARNLTRADSHVLGREDREYVRRSTMYEGETIPPSAYRETIEKHASYRTSVYSQTEERNVPRKHTRSDSDVLGAEDKELVRRSVVDLEDDVPTAV